MNREETKTALKIIKAAYQSFVIDNLVINLWSDILGAYGGDFVCYGIHTYLKNPNDFAPTPGQIRAILEQEVSRKERKPIDRSEARPPTKIDICIDHFGGRVVTQELKGIVGGELPISWASLISRKGWVKEYREKLNEMFQIAIENQPELLRGYQAEQCR